MRSGHLPLRLRRDGAGCLCTLCGWNLCCPAGTDVLCGVRGGFVHAVPRAVCVHGVRVRDLWEQNQRYEQKSLCSVRGWNHSICPWLVLMYIVHRRHLSDRLGPHLMRSLSRRDVPARRGRNGRGSVRSVPCWVILAIWDPQHRQVLLSASVRSGVSSALVVACASVGMGVRLLLSLFLQFVS